MGKSSLLTVIINVIGRKESSQNNLNRVIKELQNIEDPIDIIMVFDGENWNNMPLVKSIRCIIPDAKMVFVEKETSVPSILYNKGIALVKTKYVALFNICTEHINDRLKLFKDGIKNSSSSDKILYLSSNADYGVYRNSQFLYGVLQIMNPFSLDDFVFDLEILKKYKLNEVCFLQKKYEQELLLRIARNNSFIEIGSIIPNSKKIEYSNQFNISDRLIDAYIVRCGEFSLYKKNDEILSDFIADLKEEDYCSIIQYMGNIHKKECVAEKNSKYRILILGGIWEYHHIQVVFLNYLDKMVGSGFATYSIGYDEKYKKQNLREYDLVILCRCRSENGIEIAEYCNANRIKCIYMLDDNWLSIAKDYPKEGAIFVKGNPNYDNFLKMVSLADSVLYFNEKIKEDLQEYARSFVKFRISVNPEVFSSDKEYSKSGNLIIGYAGSLRYDSTAFKALAKVSKERNDVQILLVGSFSDEQLQLFDGAKVLIFPFSSYSCYAELMSRMRPDLLIAPLENNRTSGSKCYNKYVESGVIGSACLFSEVEPYTEVVKDGENGFFVDENTIDGWYKKINAIVDNRSALEKVKKNAKKDVFDNHSVESVLPTFIEIIKHAVEGI